MPFRTNFFAIATLATSACLPIATSSFADITFDWATVGNAGNAPDPLTGHGTVAYDYRISTTEVTNAQYVEFLNAKAKTDPLGLYNSEMSRLYGGINRIGQDGSYSYTAVQSRSEYPVTRVSWFDAIRFTNWLHNGQADGDTESGAYNLNGFTPTPSNASTIMRDTEALFFLPNREEWYKAAYHDASGGVLGEYFRYANASNLQPVSDRPEDNVFAVNYFNDDGIDNGFNDGHAVLDQNDPFNSHFLTEVGAYSGALSSYGTFDQNGNVSEFTESYLSNVSVVSDGGSAIAGNQSDLASTSITGVGVISEFNFIGFRVGAAVPEPTSLALLGLGGLLLTRRRR